MVLVFLVVSVLGTGIPTTAAYVIAVTVGAAAMGNLGVSLLAAHLFVFYYAVLSDLTPPDAVTAFAAANIAGADMFATGIEAFRLGIAGFFVPFAFVYHQELLLRGQLAADRPDVGPGRGLGHRAGVLRGRPRGWGPSRAGCGGSASWRPACWWCARARCRRWGWSSTRASCC